MANSESTQLNGKSLIPEPHSLLTIDYSLREQRFSHSQGFRLALHLLPVTARVRIVERGRP